VKLPFVPFYYDAYLINYKLPTKKNKNLHDCVILLIGFPAINFKHKEAKLWIKKSQKLEQCNRAHVSTLAENKNPSLCSLYHSSNLSLPSLNTQCVTAGDYCIYNRQYLK
jgi:hypothetical protein